MNRLKSPGQKATPFIGEFYQESPPEKPKRDFSLLLFFGMCLVGIGAAIGANIAYTSPQQQEIRVLQQQSKQLEVIKEEVCKNGDTRKNYRQQKF
ncbi:MAG: hypothetical protein AAF915_01990 [Cyanobacteria bacterium P01_D01_bin.50]